MTVDGQDAGENEVGASPAAATGSSSSSSSSLIPKITVEKRPRPEEEKDLDAEWGPSVRFDVSGTVYRVPVSMIRKYPEAYLGTLVAVDQGGLENKDVENGKLFRVDRDPLLFRYILDFYRGQSIVIPLTESVDRVSKEIDFFRLPTDAHNKIDVEMDRPTKILKIACKNVEKLGQKMHDESEAAVAVVLADAIYGALLKKIADGGTNVSAHHYECGWAGSLLHGLSKAYKTGVRGENLVFLGLDGWGSAESDYNNEEIAADLTGDEKKKKLLSAKIDFIEKKTLRHPVFKARCEALKQETGFALSWQFMDHQEYAGNYRRERLLEYHTLRFFLA